MALTVAQVLGPGGLLARALPGWEPRPAQLEMAGAVQGALKAGRPLLVEAGTGTGKTLAYLVPAILSGMKVVISTGTKNLQEQILKKDLPLLREHLPVEFSVAGLKGLSNYLCLRRYREHVAETQVREGAFGESSSSTPLVELRRWAEKTQSGDRAELADLPDDSPLWRDVSATAETRLGTRCPLFEQCFVTRARRDAQRADLLVVNHHLFFADLALRAEWPEAQLLPPYEAVIFDEAHQLEDVASDYFGRSVSSLRTAGWVRDLKRAVSQAHVDARIERTASHVEAKADDLWNALRTRLPRDGRITAGDTLWRGDPTRAWHALDNALAEAEAATAATHAETTDGEEACRALTRRARSLRDDLALLAEFADRGFVYVAETRGRTVMLRASPVDVAEAMREHLLGQTETVIFTSATLAVGGHFAYVRKRLGLASAVEAQVGSPFDFARQARLYLPRDLPEPSDPEFVVAAADRMEALVEASRARAFLLFTSHRQMTAVFKLLAPRLEAPVLLQGERPKHLLLEEFRRRPSVLFATASFWEGVDVIGDALRLVVIDKLPFAPPDDPLVQARCERIESEGDDAFHGYQVPRAAIALAQGFGRLIRHRNDRGVVALLDRRAHTRGYGTRVLSSLPPACPRTHSLDDVLQFLRA